MKPWNRPFLGPRALFRRRKPLELIGGAPGALGHPRTTCISSFTFAGPFGQVRQDASCSSPHPRQARSAPGTWSEVLAHGRRVDMHTPESPSRPEGHSWPGVIAGYLKAWVRRGFKRMLSPSPWGTSTKTHRRTVVADQPLEAAAIRPGQASTNGAGALAECATGLGHASGVVLKKECRTRKEP